MGKMKLQIRSMLIVVALSQLPRGVRFDEQEAQQDEQACVSSSNHTQDQRILPPNALDQHCQLRSGRIKGFRHCEPRLYCEYIYKSRLGQQRRCRVQTKYLPEEYVIPEAKEAIRGLVSKTANSKGPVGLFGIMNQLITLSGYIDAMSCESKVEVQGDELAPTNDSKPELKGEIHSLLTKTAKEIIGGSVRRAQITNAEFLYSEEPAAVFIARRLASIIGSRGDKCSIDVSFADLRSYERQEGTLSFESMFKRITAIQKPSTCQMTDAEWEELKKGAVSQVRHVLEKFAPLFDRDGASKCSSSGVRENMVQHFQYFKKAMAAMRSSVNINKKEIAVFSVILTVGVAIGIMVIFFAVIGTFGLILGGFAIYGSVVLMVVSFALAVATAQCFGDVPITDSPICDVVNKYFRS
eukprot:TRINITY_DN39491_c0_g1_i1.p1 TRINITY_DN39491_c0_g1~~TRINITY_DN39491_c0_g1_i1.p1  ORF type:complete len:429 (-),score=18.91 TRINITY_DN39491_c0_g1_i1:130-1359(-)